MARKNRGPRRRSETSLIALINRRNPPEGHLAVSLIYPIKCDSKRHNWAIGLKCQCGNEHPVSSGLSTDWNKNEVEIPDPRTICWCGNEKSKNEEVCYRCYSPSCGPSF